jgi:hypothetical protein
MPTSRRAPSTQNTAVAIGLSAVAGGYMASVAFREMFVKGIEPETRRNIMLLAAATCAGIAAKQFFDIDKRLVDVTSWADTAEQAIKDTAASVKK